MDQDVTLVQAPETGSLVINISARALADYLYEQRLINHRIPNPMIDAISWDDSTGMLLVMYTEGSVGWDA